MATGHLRQLPLVVEYRVCKIGGACGDRIEDRARRLGVNGEHIPVWEHSGVRGIPMPSHHTTIQLVSIQKCAAVHGRDEVSEEEMQRMNRDSGEAEGTQ
jgi:hypothetical protein